MKGRNDLQWLCVEPYTQIYYVLARVSLVYSRREWDAFVVGPGVIGGSSLPPGWVIPCDPATDIWASALQENQEFA